MLFLLDAHICYEWQVDAQSPDHHLSPLYDIASTTPHKKIHCYIYPKAVRMVSELPKLFALNNTSFFHRTTILNN